MVLLLACVVMLPAGGANVGASEGASTGASKAPTAAPAASPEATERVYDVEMYVFLFDKCGGCGVDSPGCGNCQDIVRYHGIIKGQLGNRLYDGTILYRMLNCRLEVNDHSYDAYYAAYAIPQDLYGYLPTVFLGTPEGGVYLVGEKMLDYVGEYLDKYLTSDDLAALQAEIDAKHLELYPEGLNAE
jgi:hypothetical protein